MIATPQEAAGLSRRLAALIYDAVILAGVLFGATLALMPWRGKAFDPGDPWFSAYLVGIAFLYFSLCWTLTGQTVGMRAWRIRLVRYDGLRIGWGRALLRFLLAVPSFAIVGVGLVWCFFDPLGRAWHDRGAGTRVIRAES